MKRRLFTILSALSLLLLAAGVVLGILRGPRIRVTVTREAVFQKAHPLYLLITGDGSIEDIRKMLLDDRSLVNAPLEFGQSPMYYAAAENRRDVVELLLEMGADVNARVEPDGSTPLHVAVRNKHLETVDLLLERGADPTMVNSDGRSPIDTAVTFELNEILERRTSVRQLSPTILHVQGMDGAATSPSPAKSKRNTNASTSILPAGFVCASACGARAIGGSSRASRGRAGPAVGRSSTSCAGSWRIVPPRCSCGRSRTRC